MSSPAASASESRYLPRLIAWEVTRSCMLACKHCRAAAQPTAYAGELSTDECFKLLDNIASFAKPIIILTGGEPMLRDDIYDIAAHAHSLALPVVMAPCGMLIDDDSAARIVRAGVRAISISLDGASSESHDSFRGVRGAFDAAVRGIEAAKRAGLNFQINTTITTHNLKELPAVLDLAVRLGASVFNPFLLVPTGRGKDLADQEISSEQYEQTLHWLAGQQGRHDIRIRVTCAPHYQRIIRQRHMRLGAEPAKGCMGGQSFAFISHRGKVQICGFLDVECGDVGKENFDFRKIWETSKVFGRMRDPDSYRGRCGCCEFRKVCGGCRARAYAITGDYFAEEPFCTYQPNRKPSARKDAPANQTDAPADLGELDRRILSVIQTDFPVVDQPFEVLAERLGAGADEIMRRIARLRADGVIRRIGAVLDSRSLGYASTLVAGRVPVEQLDEIAKIVNQLPGVTHNYRRDHTYNLWFTLTAESDQRVERIIEDLRRKAPAAEFHSLRAIAIYKIRVDFRMDDQDRSAKSPTVASRAGLTLTDRQKRLVRVLQEDLPLAPRLFAGVAEQAGWQPGQVIQQIAEWTAQGVIRRFGAVVRHRRLGFVANGMAVFRIPGDQVDDMGRRLADCPEVSHCYHRPTLPGFRYNLFAMVHGRGVSEVRDVVDRFAREVDVADYDVLFSTAEYKKTSMKYFGEVSRS